MTQTPNNPLRQYFRQPAIYLQLPSGGDFWPMGALNSTANKEYPVLPMTAIDEITYRTPDALFNGSAVVNVIQSCVPNIRNAWDAPGNDINSILVAIRIASYGHEMELSTVCPSCSTDAEFGIDLRVVLDGLGMGDYRKPIVHGDLEISFRPMTYKEQNETNQKQFDQQRALQQIPGSDLPDSEKISQLNLALQKITALTVGALKWSISSIKTPGALVTDPDHIEEFLNNCDRNLFNKVRDHVVALRLVSEFKPIPLKCDHCGHEYTQTLTLDQTSFFAPAS
jgi:hypothetical protein